MGREQRLWFKTYLFLWTRAAGDESDAQEEPEENNHGVLVL